MLKHFADHTCAFDAEWSPCPATARRLLGLAADASDRAATEAAWAHYRREDGPERPFLKLMLCRVASIAAVLRHRQPGGPPRLRLYSRGLHTTDEAALIRDFLEMLPVQKFQLWGFNSSGADLPMLKQRAVALAAPCPAFSRRPDKPWEGYDYHDGRSSEAHVDILALLAGYNGGMARFSLAEMAAACGLPGKLDVTGDDVAELALSGEYAKIVEYNETDALTTHLLMLRVALHTGHLAPDEHAAEVAAARRLAEEEAAKGKQQFAKFLAAWDALSPPAAPPVRPDDAALVQALREHYKALLQAAQEEHGPALAQALRAMRGPVFRGDPLTLHFAGDRAACALVQANADTVAALVARLLALPKLRVVCEVE